MHICLHKPFPYRFETEILLVSLSLESDIDCHVLLQMKSTFMSVRVSLPLSLCTH